VTVTINVGYALQAMGVVLFFLFLAWLGMIPWAIRNLNNDTLRSGWDYLRKDVPLMLACGSLVTLLLGRWLA
jgi:hypothetical protein